MHNKKFFTFLTISFVIAFSGFSQNFGAELVKNSDLTVSCPFSFTTGDIFNFAKSNVGAEVRVGTNLYQKKDKSFSMGIFTTYNCNFYLFTREEISELYSNSIIEGIWLKFLLPQNFILQADLGAGLAITKLKATDILGAQLDGNFNSFVIGTTVSVSRKFLDMGPCSLYWNTGLETRIYIEQSTCFQSFGVIAGIMVKAR